MRIRGLERPVEWCAELLTSTMATAAHPRNLWEASNCKKCDIAYYAIYQAVWNMISTGCGRSSTHSLTELCVVCGGRGPIWSGADAAGDRPADCTCASCASQQPAEEAAE